MTPQIEIVDLSPEGFVAARREIAEVYRRAFAEQQYPHPDREVVRFRNVLSRHAEHSGFRCKVARSGQEVLGVAYGYTGGSGQWWHDVVAAALPSEEAEQWLGDCFELVELHLTPEAQGRGVGGRLHDELLSGLPHSTAALSTLDARTRALYLYEKRGWVPLLTNFAFPGGAKPFLIMGLDLTSRAPAS
ncbi:MAG: GNAT family N-acetyltransferase [Actinobacteria bacterium]|nr:GNAT family N-acetyltransferase [Actinomycetota bacterium]MDQ3533612.1 GNAT family N-acetyltransferase [Actinomycetota bacterium]